MILRTIGTGSSGNCYLLADAENNVLILDAGMPVDRVKVALDFNIRAIKGVFVSHEHADHAKYLKDFRLLGCEIFTPYISGKDKEIKHMGPWTVIAFKLPHGEDTSYGAFIKHEPTNTKLLYMTDFEYCPYTFAKQRINHMIIEVNYQAKYVDLDAPNKEHKIKGHCELDTARRFINHNKTIDLMSVTLCHLGKGCEPTECIETIEDVVHCPVNVARKNQKIDLGEFEDADGRRRNCS